MMLPHNGRQSHFSRTDGVFRPGQGLPVGSSKQQPWHTQDHKDKGRAVRPRHTRPQVRGCKSPDELEYTTNPAFCQGQDRGLSNCNSQCDDLTGMCSTISGRKRSSSPTDSPELSCFRDECFQETPNLDLLPVGSRARASAFIRWGPRRRSCSPRPACLCSVIAL